MRAQPQAGTVEAFQARLAEMEQRIANLESERGQRPQPQRPAPLVFHWPETVGDFVDVRNGPGFLPSSGPIRRIEYRFDVAASVTVRWELDGVVFATHTIAANGNRLTDVLYDGGDLVATVTADSGAEGFTALVSLG